MVLCLCPAVAPEDLRDVVSCIPNREEESMCKLTHAYSRIVPYILSSVETYCKGACIFHTVSTLSVYSIYVCLGSFSAYLVAFFLIFHVFLLIQYHMLSISLSLSLCHFVLKRGVTTYIVILITLEVVTPTGTIYLEVVLGFPCLT